MSIEIDEPPRFGFNFCWHGFKVTSAIQFYAHWTDGKYDIHNFAFCGIGFEIVRKAK